MFQQYSTSDGLQIIFSFIFRMKLHIKKYLYKKTSPEESIEECFFLICFPKTKEETQFWENSINWI